LALADQLSGVLDQDLQQLPFDRSEPYLLGAFGAADHPVGDLDLPPADRDRGSGSCLPGGPPGDRADAGEEFVYAERFGDVVVGAGVEGGDLVAAARPAGEHDDGHPHQFLAQRLRSIKIAIRQETVRINSTIVATSAEDTRINS
jgi:hypothetical protein